MKNKDYLAIIVVIGALFLANLFNLTQIGLNTIRLPINPKNGFTWHCKSYDFQVVNVDDGYITDDEIEEATGEINARSEIAKSNKVKKEIQNLKLNKGKNIGITTIECKLNKAGEKQVGGNTYIVIALTNTLVFYANVNVLLVVCVALLLYAIILVIFNKLEKKKFRKTLNKVNKTEKKGKFV